MTAPMTAVEPRPLDAPMVRALRHADCVVFRFVDGVSWLEAIRRADHTADGFEQSIRHPVGTSLTAYDRDHSWVPGDELAGYTGFHMESSANFDEHAITLMGLLRANDEVTLRWVRGNASPLLTEGGYVRDDLYLIIKRASAKRAEVHLVDVSVGRDNSARMIQKRR